MYDIRMHVQVTDRSTGEVLIENISHDFNGIAPSPFLSDENARKCSAEALATIMFLARFENMLLVQNQEYAKAVAGRRWYVTALCHFSNFEGVQNESNTTSTTSATG